jgi:hypothetical protein
MPLEGDLNRQTNPNTSNTSGFRIAATSSVTGVNKVKDTLNIPFFDDFTGQAAYLDSVINNSSSPVQFISQGLHGLYDHDKIFVTGYAKDPLLKLNGRKYIRRISPFKFDIFKDAALTDPLLGNDTIIYSTENPIWIRENDVPSNNPDTLKWMQGGGTYINNRYCVSPPSFNTATFDGLNANGKAYNNTNAYVTGMTDSLTSLPIDLSTIQPSDSLYINFYWQRGGLGETPDQVDSLYLQFKNSLDIWKNVWSKRGKDTSETFFTQEFISIKDPLYFYKGFQFRFIAQGEMGGSYDVWNLDYVHLDTSKTEKIHKDVTIQNIGLSILKNYTAMPFKQFFANKTNELADSVNLTITNLFNADLTCNDGGTDYLSNELKHVKLSNIILNYGSSGTAFKNTSRKVGFKIDPVSIKNDTTNQKLKYYLSLSAENSFQNDIQYRTNDSISGYTILDNYYAYDDSSAEWGWGINQASGKVAVKFPLNIPDTLVAIDIFFPHQKQNYTGEPLDLIVWSSIFPEVEMPGSRTSVALTYSGGNNLFKRFYLNNVQYVKDTIYIGYQQGANYKVPIGFDVNTDSRTKSYFNISNSWSPVTDTGTLMIRPVFKNGSKLVAGILQPKPSPAAALDCEVYPNPTTGILNIIGTIKEATLTDLSGKIMMEQTFSPSLPDKTMELQNIPAGFYLLRLSNNEAYTIKKIVLVK